ncbi:MAG: autotransporter-associated beta strand repeat-containing protein, partial [Chthoniobacterales bacterium]
DGVGNTTFTGANTYSGGTTISAGTLQIGAGGTVGSITGNVIDNAALKFKHSDSVVFAGNISGAGTLEQAGSGTLILTGDTSHRGGTTISAGTLQVGNAGTTGTLSGNVVNNNILAFNRTDALSVNGNISGTGSVQQNGTGSTTLGGVNTYTGGTTINAGTLAAGSATATGAGTGTLTLNGTGTFDLNANNISTGVLNGAIGTTITNEGASDATLTTSSSNGTFAGLIQDGATNKTAIARSGTGALTLSHANTYTGGTTLNAGTLNLANASAIGTGALTVAGTSTLDNTTGSSLTLSTNNAVNLNADLTFKGTNDLNLGTGAVTLTGNSTIRVTANTLTVGGVISGAFGLTNAGSSTLILLNENTYTGVTNILSGALQLGNGGSTGSVAGNIVNTGTLIFDRSDTGLNLSGVISGVGRVQQDGSGSTTLSGANTYVGGAVINAGTLVAGSATALGNPASSLTIHGGTFDLNGNNIAVAMLNGDTGATITNGNSVNATLTTSSSIAEIFAGKIQDGNHTTALVKSGTGPLTLSGASTYSGGTTLNGGTLNLNNASAIGVGIFNIAGTSTIDNVSGSALTLSTNNAQTWGADFAFKGTNDLNLGTGAVTLTANRTITATANNLTVGGVISGAFSLNKAGAGRLTLNGANAYTGGTTLTSGQLN